MLCHLFVFLLSLGVEEEGGLPFLHGNMARLVVKTVRAGPHKRVDSTNPHDSGELDLAGVLDGDGETAIVPNEEHIAVVAGFSIVVQGVLPVVGDEFGDFFDSVFIGEQVMTHNVPFEKCSP